METILKSCGNIFKSLENLKFRISFRKSCFALLVITVFIALKTDSVRGGEKIDPRAMRLIEEIDKICKSIPNDNPDALEGAAYSIMGPRTKLIRLGKSATSAINQVILDKNSDFKTRFFLIGVLEETKDPMAVSALTELLFDSKEVESLRGETAMPIAAMGGKEAEETLKKAVIDNSVGSSTSSIVREKVMMAIGQYGLSDIEFLRKMAGIEISSWGDVGMHFNAIRALGHSKNSKAMDVLFEFVKKYPDDSLSKGVVIEALANQKDPRGIPVVGEILLKNKDAHYRIKAAQALGAIGSREGVNYLLQALNDQEILVIWRVIEALGKIGDPVATKPVCELVKNAINDKRFSRDIDQKTGKPVPGLIALPTMIETCEKLKKIE